MHHQIGERQLQFDLLGRGPRTVCFAHALAADSGMWAEQVPALLGRGFRVLTIDMRGHGGSVSVAGDYTLKELAGDVAGVLAAMELEKVDFVGLSVGGMIGEALAIHFKERVASLFLCESPPASLKSAREIWAPRMASARAANSLEPIAEATMVRWLTEEFRARNPARWRQIRETVASTSVAGYCGCIAALSNFDFTRDLSKLAVPALVLCGEEDKASSLEENRKLAELIPRGRFVAFAGARHLPNVEAPERFNRILLEWLDGTSA